MILVHDELCIHPKQSKAQPRAGVRPPTLLLLLPATKIPHGEIESQPACRQHESMLKSLSFHCRRHCNRPSHTHGCVRWLHQRTIKTFEFGCRRRCDWLGRRSAPMLPHARGCTSAACTPSSLMDLWQRRASPMPRQRQSRAMASASLWDVCRTHLVFRQVPSLTDLWLRQGSPLPHQWQSQGMGSASLWVV